VSLGTNGLPKRNRTAGIKSGADLVRRASLLPPGEPGDVFEGLRPTSSSGRRATVDWKAILDGAAHLLERIAKTPAAPQTIRNDTGAGDGERDVHQDTHTAEKVGLFVPRCYSSPEDPSLAKWVYHLYNALEMSAWYGHGDRRAYFDPAGLYTDGGVAYMGKHLDLPVQKTSDGKLIRASEILPISCARRPFGCSVSLLDRHGQRATRQRSGKG